MNKVRVTVITTESNPSLICRLCAKASNLLYVRLGLALLSKSVRRPNVVAWSTSLMTVIIAEQHTEPQFDHNDLPTMGWALNNFQRIACFVLYKLPWPNELSI